MNEPINSFKEMTVPVNCTKNYQRTVSKNTVPLNCTREMN